LGLFYSQYNKGDPPMKKQFFAILFCLPLAVAYGRSPDSGEDSTKVYHVADVVVTATRSEILLKDSPSPVQVLTTQDILRTNGSSAVDILRSSESIFLKDYGPTAGLKTVSFRGMASEHIIVLLDGIRMNNFQNGQVDFSLFPMNNIDRIEVVRGGNSALYGADALGGIINIVTRRPTETLQLHVDASIGSFDYRRYSLETSGRVQGLGLVFGIMHDRSKENYPFIFHRIGVPDTIQRRDGADFTRTQLYLNSDFSIDDHSLITLSLQRVKSNQGVPGSLKYSSNMRQDDDAVTTVAAIRDNHFDRFIFSLNMGFTYDLQMYYSHTKTTLRAINPQMQCIVNTWDRLVIGGEFVEGNLEGMILGAIIKRVQRSVYVSNEMLFQRESATFDRLSLYKTVRYDALSEGEDAFSPKIGINLRVFKDWDTRIRASYGKNFRMPTFNDLYDSWLGNLTLRPENSECIDAGIETALDRSNIQTFQFTYFNINTRDRILPNASYFPVNVYRAQSRGVEARYDLHLPWNALNIYADITMNDAVRHNDPSLSDSTDGKQLLYIPKFVSSFGVSIKVFDLSFNVVNTLTSKRYIKEDESQWLPAYSLTNVNLSISLHLALVRLSFRTEVSNLFDADYQVLPYYPMPGRTFRLSVGIEY
jgi:outer membrane cobalamin receptor